MKRTLFRVAAAFLAAAALTFSASAADFRISATHAILLDCGSGRVLYEKRSDEKALIASTTKIMTALVVLRTSSLDDPVKIPQAAVGIEGSSVYLKAGEILSVRELLLGMMLQSGNDAAVALALHCGGSIGGFVEEMNREADRLGLKHTHFANPNGLDDEENYSTARDLATLASTALENPEFHAIVSTKTASVGPRTVTNHNKLLWQYEGAVGVKTGYTKAAGRILVSAAERDGRRLVAVTINAPDDWTDHKTLLDYGFSQFTLKTFVQAGDEVGRVDVLSGLAPEAAAVAEDDLKLVLAAGETPTFRVYLPHLIFAPVSAGAKAGYITAELNGREIARVGLVWDNTVLEKKKEKTLLGSLFGG